MTNYDYDKLEVWQFERRTHITEEDYNNLFAFALAKEKQCINLQALVQEIKEELIALSK